MESGPAFPEARGEALSGLREGNMGRWGVCGEGATKGMRQEEKKECIVLIGRAVFRGQK